MDPYPRQTQRSGCLTLSKGRIILALLVALVSVIGYYSSREYNPITGEVQYLDLSPEQEIALGLQAAPEMAAQFGGLLDNPEAQAFVDQVCAKLIAATAVKETPYQFECHLLADPETVNAFALPGGQVFITAALFGALETEGQLSGVLGHEIGHVAARHSAEHIAKQKLTQGLTGAAVLATYDPNDPSTQHTAQIAALIGGLVNMRFGREDELEADRLGVRFMSEAGFDPRSLIGVMEILAKAGGGGRQPEFFSTHPNPENRGARIEAAIAERFPGGVPAGLTP
jgi:predicted Zn-dependent protease